MGLGSVNRDLTYIRQQAKNNIKKYIDERLPEEYEKCLVGLNAIVKNAIVNYTQIAGMSKCRGKGRLLVRMYSTF